MPQGQPTKLGSPSPTYNPSHSFPKLLKLFLKFFSNLQKKIQNGYHVLDTFNYFGEEVIEKTIKGLS